MEKELSNGIFIVMRSQCGDISQTEYDSSHKTLDAAQKYANKEAAETYRDDDQNYWVFQALGVAKRPDKIPVEYYQATHTPPKPRAPRKKTAKKSSGRKATRRKKTSIF